MLTDVGLALVGAGSLAGGLVLRKRRSGSRI
jgi:LPXTG-motif cell wall-anchored protein